MQRMASACDRGTLCPVRFWVAVGVAVLAMCGSAEGAVQHLRASTEVRRWVTPERFAAQDPVAVKITRRGRELARRVNECGGVYADRRLLVRVRVCGSPRLRFTYIALGRDVPFRIVYLRA